MISKQSSPVKTETLTPSKSLSVEELSFLENLYAGAFPPEERREWQLIVSPQKEGCPSLTAVRSSEGNIIGLITIWNFPEFVYIEHFAMDPSLRGHGIGGKIIDMIIKDSNPKPVVLEVETPEHEGSLSHRRVNFYKRHGFVLLDYNYIQPPYREGLPEVEMKLMSTSPEVSPRYISSRLYSEVYKVPFDNTL